MTPYWRRIRRTCGVYTGLGRRRWSARPSSARPRQCAWPRHRAAGAARAVARAPRAGPAPDAAGPAARWRDGPGRVWTGRRPARWPGQRPSAAGRSCVRAPRARAPCARAPCARASYSAVIAAAVPVSSTAPPAASRTRPDTWGLPAPRRSPSPPHPRVPFRHDFCTLSPTLTGCELLRPGRTEGSCRPGPREPLPGADCSGRVRCRPVLGAGAARGTDARPFPNR